MDEEREREIENESEMDRERNRESGGVLRECCGGAVGGAARSAAMGATGLQRCV